MATSDQWQRRPAPPLTAITSIIRTAAPALEALDHVVQLLDALLDGTVHISLATASASGCIRLFDRVYLHAVYSHPAMDATLLEYKLSLAWKAAIQHGNLEMVKRIHTVHPQRLTMKLYSMAASQGDLSMLQWLLAHRTDGLCTIEDDTSAIRKVPFEMKQVPHCCLLSSYDRACTQKQFHIVRWFYESGPPYRVERPSWSKLGDDAAATDDLEVVQWVFAHMPDSFSQSALDNASRGGHLHVVRFLVANCKERCANSAVYHALFNGHDHVAQYLRAQELVTLSVEPMSVVVDAFAAGREDLLESDWFLSLIDWHAQESSDTLYAAMVTACEFGRLRMVQWLVEHHQISCQGTAPMNAAKNGHWHIIEWIHSARGIGRIVRITEIAAANGHLTIVQWAHTHRKVDRVGTNAMDSAAANGHLEVVQWLHENRSEGCLTHAMDHAATNGHLHVVQWLHRNRTEGCTFLAMDGAASNGHLHVVQWLHENRMEGCTTNAMDDAASNGHLEMVMWLHTHRTEGCTTKAMDCGSLLVCKWLHLHRHEGCDPASATAFATKKRSIPKLMFLLENYYVDQYPAEVAAQVAVDGHLPLLQWLQTKYPQEFDTDDRVRQVADAQNHGHILSWLNDLE